MSSCCHNTAVYYFKPITQMNLRHHALKTHCWLSLINGFPGLAIATTKKAMGVILWVDGFSGFVDFASQ